MRACGIWSIKAPLFAVAGSLETHTRLRDMVHDQAVAAVNSPPADYTVIEEGNHSLINRREEAASICSGRTVTTLPSVRGEPFAEFTLSRTEGLRTGLSNHILK